MNYTPIDFEELFDLYAFQAIVGLVNRFLLGVLVTLIAIWGYYKFAPIL